MALVGTAAGCQAPTVVAEEPEVAAVEQAQLDDLAEQCGLDIDCKLGGIAEGRANISGVPSVDAFFAAVVNFQTKAEASASGIDAQLAGIRADFGLAANAGIGAGIKAQATTYLEGGLKIVAEPARCQIDAKASVEATARCEGEVMPPKAMVDCQGSCEVDASAKVDCGVDADVQCTVTAPSIECSGSCRGSCTVEGTAAASCSGTCNGTCMGTCSAMNAMGQCAGSCEGTCMGSCKAELKAEASCMGKCEGECTVKNPMGGCMAAVRARCEGKAMAMVKCEGRCDGEVTPPSAKVECQASAKADASFNAECTPPRIAVDFNLKAGASADAAGQARFVAAVKNLEVRLPKLMASLKGAQLAVKGAAGLGVAGKAAVDGAIKKLQGDADIKAAVGLKCAVGELGGVADAIESGTSRLTTSIQATAELTGALGLNG